MNISCNGINGELSIEQLHRLLHINVRIVEIKITSALSWSEYMRNLYFSTIHLWTFAEKNDKLQNIFHSTQNAFIVIIDEIYASGSAWEMFYQVITSKSSRTCLNMNTLTKLLTYKIKPKGCVSLCS